MGKAKKKSKARGIGRNDPCPCGSGLKWKRCCMSKSVPISTSSAPMRSLELLLDDLPPVGSTMFTPAAAKAVAEGQKLPGMEHHPWIRVRLADWLGIMRGKNGISLTGMRVLQTEKIIEELGRVGVKVDKETFVLATERHSSAWELSEEWCADAISVSTDFLGLAACELWRRLCPEHPSLEMLDEQMQAGYVALEAGHPKRACEIWLDFTDRLLERLPDAETLADADAAFPGLNSIWNWISDAEVELHNASLDDRDLARRGIDWCRKLNARFDDDRVRRGLRRQQADFHLTLGEAAEGESLLEQLIDEDPDDAMPYCHLASWLGSRRNNPCRDVDRAIEVLQTALDRPVRNAADYSLLSRLEDLRKRAS